MRHAVIATLLLASFAISSPAQQDFAAHAAAQLAMNSSPESPAKPAKTERRKDLEDALQGLAAKPPASEVYFYDDEEAATTPFDRTPFRLVAVTPSTGQVYRLGGFAASPGPAESLQEFNRLTSSLALSISKDRAISLAALFLDSAVPGGPGNVALDDEAMWLRLAVQNYYFEAYGDVWRALEAYAGWWEQFSAAVPALAPSVTAQTNGSYRVNLKRLARISGRQPEIQNWDLEVSRTGEIHVLSMQLMFPVHPNWVFYDFR